VQLGVIERPGEVVGEIVALGGGTRSATVTALQASQVTGLEGPTFERLVSSRPLLAKALTELASRRSEEVELVGILASRFGVTDDDSVADAISSVKWHRLNQGDVLFREGDGSDALYLVIRGRLAASRYDETEGRVVRRGEAARGDVVGEVGLIRRVPRAATMVALRDTVLAGLDESAFLRILDREPRMMIEVGLRAMARAEQATERSSPNTVLAVMGTSERTGRVVDGLVEELERHGRVLRLSAWRAERMLEVPGISETKSGEVGDVRLSKLLHEAELENDHVVLEMGQTEGAWSRRCLGMADRVLMVLPAHPSDADLRSLRRILDACPSDFHRTVVLVHSGEDPPRGSSAVASRLAAEEVLHLRDGAGSDVARLARVASGRGTALVLSGGGGRGFAHIGVWRALRELGLPVDIVGGSSVGAILGSVMADGVSPEQLVEWARLHFRRPLDYTIPVVSLIKGERIARSTREVFGDRTIEDLWCKYFAVSTNLTASRVNVHRQGPIDLAIRATSAIPGVMPPVPFGDDLLIDGGVLNNLPIDVARDLTPAGRIVAVDVASPRGPGARSDYGLSVSGWSALRSTMGGGRRAYPGISAVLMRSMIISSTRERDDQVASGAADCYLDLDMRGVSMLDFDDPEGVALRGYEAAMPTLEEFLASGSGFPQ
ncbi:MAG: patatin-like phospholipase family protein, partial [Actinomycetota bacterium]